MTTTKELSTGADLALATEGTLLVSGGAANLEISGATRPGRLFDARFHAQVSAVTCDHGTVTVRYRRRPHPFTIDHGEGWIELSRGVPWEVRVSGAAADITADLSALTVTGLSFDGPVRNSPSICSGRPVPSPFVFTGPRATCACAVRPECRSQSRSAAERPTSTSTARSSAPSPAGTATPPVLRATTTPSSSTEPSTGSPSPADPPPDIRRRKHARERGVHMVVGVDPVPRCASRCGGQGAFSFEVAHVLDRAANPSSDVDRAQASLGMICPQLLGQWAKLVYPVEGNPKWLEASALSPRNFVTTR